MIIPIGHNRSTREWPWATIALIALCTLVQVYSDYVTPSDDELTDLAFEYELATTPEEILAVERTAEAILKTVPTFRWGYETGSGLTLNALLSAFVHGGWLHLAGNMLFLWLAGSLLEDRWGRWRYLVFYGAGAVVSTLAFNAFYDGAPTILVGASGAVSATLGAFLVHFHSAKVKFFYFFFFRFTGTFEVRAYVALPFWFLDQLLSASLGSDGVLTGTAYSAHIGGFAFGLSAAFLATKLVAKQTASQTTLPTAKVLKEDTTVPSSQAGRLKQGSPTPPADERYLRCIAALNEGATSTLSEDASAVVVSMAKQSRHEEVLDFYRLIQEKTETFSFAEAAMLELLRTADRQSVPSLYLELSASFLANHPASSSVPGILWRVAQLQEQAGSQDLARQALQELADNHAEHFFGAKARDSLTAG